MNKQEIMRAAEAATKAGNYVRKRELLAALNQREQPDVPVRTSTIYNGENDTPVNMDAVYGPGKGRRDIPGPG